MPTTKNGDELEQSDYRVRKSIDCIVTVEAASHEEADEKVKNAENWVYEQESDVTDWEIRGRA